MKLSPHNALFCPLTERLKNQHIPECKTGRQACLRPQTTKSIV